MTVAEAEITDEAKRLETERVSAYLARTPRLRDLLEYLVARCLAGECDQLTEYNIATEVFGRRKDQFVASDDAIARVETHRLRKRLKTYYETEGALHTVRICLPAGTYTPCFQEREPAEPMSPVLPPAPPETVPVPAIPVPPAPQDRRGLLAALGACVLAVLCIVLWLHHGRAPRPASLTGGGHAGASTARNLGVHVPFSMMAGYNGPDQLDASGNVWTRDQYFTEGWDQEQPKVFVGRTNDPLMYAYARMGDSSYDIPLAPGTYELHLYFIQMSQTEQSEESEMPSAFNLTANGKTILPWFDIVSDAMGRNIADERIFRDISPDADGELHLHLSTAVGTPTISAIRIIPGISGRTQPIRIITQPTPFTDSAGHLWQPDSYYLGGRHLAHDLPQDGSERPWLSTERYGHFDYAIPVDTRDQYTLKLYFMELYFGRAGLLGVGSRIFRVLCNGHTLLDNFDILRDTGPMQVDEKTFTHLQPTAQGKLNIAFEPVQNYATVSAIEVIDEGPRPHAEP